MGMTDQQALDLMIDDTFQEREEATAKLQRAQLSSCQLPTYYAGFKAWLQIRERIKQNKGSASRCLTFTDRALKEGSVPLSELEALIASRSRAGSAACEREPSMGNTCSSVHIALTGTTPDAIKGIVRAYTTLGFERAKTAPPEGGKHVILLRKEGDAFLSVYDSDNAALDTGELKDLALAASKIFKTAAVCTSLYDSDTFEVVVFNAGKQVDLVMTDPEQYSGPLKILSDASRAAQWSKVFGKSLSVEGITQAITRNSAFADDALAELSRLIGLTGGQSQLHYQDLREDEALTHHLHFTKQPSAPRAVPEGQIALRNYFDPDNSRMLLVNPASWPVPLLEEIRVTWLMLSEGAGFNDGTLAIHVNGPDGLAITAVTWRDPNSTTGRLLARSRPHRETPPEPAPRTCSNRDSSRSRRVHRVDVYRPISDVGHSDEGT